MNNFEIDINAIKNDIISMFLLSNKSLKLHEIYDLIYTADYLKSISSTYHNFYVDPVNPIIKTKAEEKIEKFKIRNFSKQYMLFYENMPILKQITLNFVEKYASYSVEDQYEYKKINFKELKERILQFYATIDNSEYQIAKSIFDEKRIGVYGNGNDNNIAFTCGSSILKNGYIFIGNEKITENTIILLIHEIAHIIDSIKASNNKNYISNAFININGELRSYMYETLYMKQNINLNQEHYNYFIADLVGLLTYFLCNNYLYFTDNYKIRNFDFTATSDDDTLPMKRTILYSFPIYLSLKLLEKNYEQKDILSNINYLMKKNYKYNINEIIDIFGMDVFDFVNYNINEGSKKYLKKNFKA